MNCDCEISGASIYTLGRVKRDRTVGQTQWIVILRYRALQSERMWVVKRLVFRIDFVILIQHVSPNVFRFEPYLYTPLRRHTFFGDLFYADKPSFGKNPSTVCGTVTLYCGKRSWNISLAVLKNKLYRGEGHRPGWLFIFLGSLVCSNGLPCLRAYHSERTSRGVP